MNSRISTWLRRSQVVLAGTALIFTISALPNPSLATSKPKPRAVPSKIQSMPNPSLAKSKPKPRAAPSKIQSMQQSDQKWIQINLSKQRLIAWKGNKRVYAIVISSGKKSTPTRRGTFAVQYKAVTARMKGSDYDVPDVPYVMYYDNNYAIHGAYWHRRFGTPVSHGCTNLAVNHAKWLFKWASVGTPVIIN
ncbi:MAG: L,D-transpeptidase family protein [Crinalium sp.]